MVDLICCKSSVKFIVYKNIEIYLNITFWLRYKKKLQMSFAVAQWDVLYKYCIK